MAKGWVTTARGEQLNLDQLITNSRRPVDAPQEETEIKKRVIPKRKPLNVRGYKPDTGESKAPEMPEEMVLQLEKRTKKATPPRKVAYREGGVAESYSDLTGVRLKPTEGAIERRKEMIAKMKDQAVEADEGKTNELREIMAELEGHDEDVPEKKPVRRTRKKSE